MLIRLFSFYVIISNLLLADIQVFNRSAGSESEIRTIRDKKVLYMSTKDLVAYVTDDLDRYYEEMSDEQFISEAQDYWEDHFDDVVEEIREYADCDFKKDRREDYLDSLSEGKDLDDYGSKVDALVDSMSVTDKEVSTTHRRRDLDTL